MRCNQNPLLIQHFANPCCQEDIDQCLECRASYSILWKSGTRLRNLGAISKSIRRRTHRDQITAGINQICQPNSLKWIKWGRLATFQTLREWGIQTQTTCLLHNSQDESRGYLFFNCSKSRIILLFFAETLNHCFLEAGKHPHPHTVQP